VMLLLYL